MVLLALAGTISDAGYCTAVPDGAVFPPEDTAGPVTGDNSCTACLDQCNTRYPAFRISRYQRVLPVWLLRQAPAGCPRRMMQICQTLKHTWP